jgi:hypothetical protein
LAKDVGEIVKGLVPLTWEAFDDFVLGAVTLSRLEVEAIRAGRRDVPGKGESAEFLEKIKRFGW